MPLYLPYSYSANGVSYKYIDKEFSKVIYHSKLQAINFFDSLGRLNGIQLEKCKEHKREEFNFYYTVYDLESEKIKIKKLTV